MPETADKSRALRLQRLRTMLETQVERPEAALETLMSELRLGEPQFELWKGLHAAADRDGKELELAEAYRKVAVDRRLKQLAPAMQGQILMHAADFHQGVLGDSEGGDAYL